jgi:effector-binding domain-containing protein
MECAPAGLYFTYDEKAGTTDMAAATMVKGGGPVPELASFEIPAGKEACVDYYGAYDKVGAAHYSIDEFMKEKGVKAGIPVIESYLNDPMVEKDTAKWLTRVIYPLVK